MRYIAPYDFPKNCPLSWEIRTPSNTWFIGRTRPTTPNGFSRFFHNTRSLSTDRRTDRLREHRRNNRLLKLKFYGTDTDIDTDFRDAPIVYFVNVYTIVYHVQYTYTRVHARISNGHPREEKRTSDKSPRTSGRAEPLAPRQADFCARILARRSPCRCRCRCPCRSRGI